MITGLRGCSCHPFASWDECEKYHNQKFKLGDRVKNRHLGTIGTIYEICTDKGYVIVKYGELPRDRHLEHVALLERLT